MMLSQKEIKQCLDEHKLIREKYLSKECLLSCFTNSSPRGITISLEDFLNNEKHLNWLPDRKSFFNSMNSSGKFSYENDNCNFLEIGTADGANALRISKEFSPKKLWLIDPYEFQNDRSADRGHNQMIHNRAFNKAKNILHDQSCEFIVNYSKNVVDRFKDEFFDFIYVDGDHSYEGCKADLDMYYPKLKKGGVMSGHDFTGTKKSMKLKGFGVQKAVCEFLNKNSKKLDFITICIETEKPEIILPFDWGFIK